MYRCVPTLPPEHLYLPCTVALPSAAFACTTGATHSTTGARYPDDGALADAAPAAPAVSAAAAPNAATSRFLVRMLVPRFVRFGPRCPRRHRACCRGDWVSRVTAGRSRGVLPPRHRATKVPIAVAGRQRTKFATCERSWVDAPSRSRTAACVIRSSSVVLPAACDTARMLLAMSVEPIAASDTERAISLVVAVCCSTAEAIETWKSL